MIISLGEGMSLDMLLTTESDILKRAVPKDTMEVQARKGAFEEKLNPV